jgi:hypothetical protein
MPDVRADVGVGVTASAKRKSAMADCSLLYFRPFPAGVLWCGQGVRLTGYRGFRLVLTVYLPQLCCGVDDDGRSFMCS